MVENGGGTRAHLVLSAGGVKCISYAGALAVLAERGVSFASVSSCSAGSLVGALLCAGKRPQEIEGYFYEADFKQFKGRWALWPPPFYRPHAWYKKSGVPEMFRRLVGDLTFKDLLDRTGIPFALAGIDIASQRLLVYSAEEHGDMRVAEALGIATSVPFYHPPYEAGGRIVVDAALASQCPVWLAAEYDEELPIVALQPEKQPLDEHPKWPPHYLAQLMDAAIASRDFYLQEQLPRVRMVRIDCGKIRSTQTRLSRKQKERLVAAGRDAAADALRLFGDDLSNPGGSVARSAGEGRDARAEDAAGRRWRKFNRSLQKMMRDRVFISYSRDDEVWFERFRTHLGPYVRSGSIGLWDDTQIGPGEKWEEKINEALLRTKVALLLVTPNYLNSDFINSTELPHFVAAAERKELTILWVPVSPASVEETALDNYQSAHPRAMERPLAAIDDPAELDQAIKEICQAVKKAIGR